MTEREAHDQLSSDYAASGDLSFTLQHVVDAYAAQHATRDTKPITLFFALVGLYLRVQTRFSGRRVQYIHQLLARRKQGWPAIPPAAQKGTVSALDVVAEPIGPARDEAVDKWCESVWNLYSSSHSVIVRGLHDRGIDV